MWQPIALNSQALVSNNFKDISRSSRDDVQLLVKDREARCNLVELEGYVLFPEIGRAEVATLGRSHLWTGREDEQGLGLTR